jgi:hypothetical protein
LEVVCEDYLGAHCVLCNNDEHSTLQACCPHGALRHRGCFSLAAAVIEHDSQNHRCGVINFLLVITTDDVQLSGCALVAQHYFMCTPQKCDLANHNVAIYVAQGAVWLAEVAVWIAQVTLWLAEVAVGMAQVAVWLAEVADWMGNVSTRIRGHQARTTLCGRIFGRCRNLLLSPFTPVGFSMFTDTAIHPRKICDLLLSKSPNTNFGSSSTNVVYFDANTSNLDDSIDQGESSAFASNRIRVDLGRARTSEETFCCRAKIYLQSAQIITCGGLGCT